MFLNRKFLVNIFIFLISLFPLISQNKNANSGITGKTPTTTKSVEAKKAVDELKKNPNSKKKEAVVVYNEDFVKGEELFQLNKPEEAIVYFEKSLEAENIDPNVYIFLGVCYYQIEKYDKSLEICVKGLAKEETDHKILAYNAGNSCYAMGNYMRADASYAISLREDPSYAPAVLNRANAQLKLDHLEDSKNNYIKYLELDPETPQRERIETIIRLLEEEIAHRAKQKPELINPDSFVENEKMEVPVIPEKVENEEIPVEVKEKPLAPESVGEDAIAPAIPAEQMRIESADSEIVEEKAPAIPAPIDHKKSSNSVKGNASEEKIAQPESDLPEPKVKDDTPAPKEKIKNPESDIPAEKKQVIDTPVYEKINN